MDRVNDELHSFLFDGLPVRGMLVRLQAGWREVQQRRAERDPWPAPVRELIGQMAAAGVLLHANIKYGGALVLQIFGDGPVRLAVAEVQADLGFRATAKVDDKQPLPAEATLRALVDRHGRGRCAITLEPRHAADLHPGPAAQSYQGIVALHDGDKPLLDMAAVIEHYMRQSEQLQTRLLLAADERCAAGLLLQRLPTEGERNLAARGAAAAPGANEDFERLALLAGTLKQEELLRLDADTLLRRLFWQERVQRFEPRRPRFACGCSQARVVGMLRGLGRAEVDDIIAERGTVEVGCEFCGRQYRFDAVDVGRLFTPEQNHPPAPGEVQ